MPRDRPGTDRPEAIERPASQAFAGADHPEVREADRLIAEGKIIGEVAKALEISDYTYLRWRSQYGGMKADDAKELRRLKDENGRLKRVVLT